MRWVASRLATAAAAAAAGGGGGGDPTNISAVPVATGTGTSGWGWLERVTEPALLLRNVIMPALARAGAYIYAYMYA